MAHTRLCYEVFESKVDSFLIFLKSYETTVGKVFFMLIVTRMALPFVVDVLFMNNKLLLS